MIEGAPVELVERFISLFHRRWPEAEELRELVTDDVRFVERPNLVNPSGSVRDREAMVAGIEAGKALLAWQSYEILGHVAEGDTVATRFRWQGELAIDAGSWPAGTRLTAWSVAHYEIRDGRIARIEQHDCYEPVGGRR